MPKDRSKTQLRRPANRSDDGSADGSDDGSAADAMVGAAIVAPRQPNVPGPEGARAPTAPDAIAVLYMQTLLANLRDTAAADCPRAQVSHLRVTPEGSGFRIAARLMGEPEVAPAGASPGAVYVCAFSFFCDADESDVRALFRRHAAAMRLAEGEEWWP